MSKHKKTIEPEHDGNFEEPPNESEALVTALVLVDSKWEGNSDFDKGMRLLQKTLGIKRAKK